MKKSEKKACFELSPKTCWGIRNFIKNANMTENAKKVKKSEKNGVRAWYPYPPPN